MTQARFVGSAGVHQRRAAHRGSPRVGYREPPAVVTGDPRSAQLVMFTSADRRQNGSCGFILADLSLKHVYANDAAFHILNYSRELPETTERASLVQERLRATSRLLSTPRTRSRPRHLRRGGDDTSAGPSSY